MSIAWTIVSLRWRLTLATWRKSAWQLVGAILGLLMALGAVVAIAAGLVALGALPHWLDIWAPAETAAASDFIRLIMVFLGVIAGVIWTVIPLSLTGDGSSLSPRRFAFFGVADRQLTAGILLSALLGLPALSLLTCLLVGVSTYRSFGVVAMLAAVLTALLAVLVFVSIYKALISLVNTIVRSKRGQNLLYLVIIVLVVLVVQIPSQAASFLGDRLSGLSLSSAVVTLSPLADGLSWTPWGAPFALPTDLTSGNVVAFLGHLLVAVAAISLAFALSTWCLRRDRQLGTDSKTSQMRRKGLGLLGRTPDSISGAVTGRLAVYWLRDGRYSMGLIAPVILAVLYGVQSVNVPGLLWALPVVLGLVFGLAETNNLAFDGKAFTLHALAGVSGRADRLGRARVPLLISLVYLLAAIIVLAVLNPAGTAFGSGLQPLIGAGGTGLAVSLSGIGLSEVLSTVLLYPVPSIDRPFSSPQGRTAAQAFFPFAQILGVIVLCLPTGAAWLINFLLPGGLAWWVGLVGLVNGVVVFLLGLHLGGRLLDRRLPVILTTLDSFASLQK